MEIFSKIKEPVILKEDSSAKDQLQALEQLLSDAKDSKLKTLLTNDIAAVRAGLFGEDAILFELKNSHIPMFVLHDLYLEHEGLSAQIDFMVITRRCQFVIECKNLYGNITINSSGEFIRIIGKKKEGIYSPVTQGKRHLELIKQMRGAEQGNVLSKSLFERYFYESYRSVVVLANSKTILDAENAPKEIKDQVIRADQLIEYMHRVNNEFNSFDSTDKSMEELANYFLSKHSTNTANYLEKYHSFIEPPEQAKGPDTEIKTQAISVVSDTSRSDGVPLCPKCGAHMIKRKAEKGKNIGREFWGCPKFPKCRGIINIQEKGTAPE